MTMAEVKHHRNCERRKLYAGNGSFMSVEHLNVEANCTISLSLQTAFQSIQQQRQLYPALHFVVGRPALWAKAAKAADISM